MTTSLLTPFDFSNATKVGRSRFRKQILPMRTINYKGNDITFDRPFLQELVRSFKARAYDQVPFVLADGENRHNESPENFRGYIADLVLTSDGLDAVLDLSKAGAKLVQENPTLGVSARILQDPPRSDGRRFGKVLRHVLATMDPRVTGMRPWQAVDLSDNEKFEVVDLTTETYQGRNTHMPKGTGLRLGSVDAKSKTATIDLSALSDDEFEAMLDLADDEVVEIDPKTKKPIKASAVPAEVDEEVDPDALEDPDAEEEGDEELDAEDAVVPGTGETPPATNPSLKKRKTTVEEEAVDQGDMVASLSNRFADFEAKQAKDAWSTKKAGYVKAGVPPFLVDLASPFMESPDSQTIELSNGGGSHDVKETLDKMLQGFTGLIDLTPEMGSSIDLSDVGQKNDPDQGLLDEWSATYGD